MKGLERSPHERAGALTPWLERSPHGWSAHPMAGALTPWKGWSAHPMEGVETHGGAFNVVLARWQLPQAAPCLWGG
jgi:hypothetical protein